MLRNIFDFCSCTLYNDLLIIDRWISYVSTPFDFISLLMKIQPTLIIIYLIVQNFLFSFTTSHWPSGSWFLHESSYFLFVYLLEEFYSKLLIIDYMIISTTLMFFPFSKNVFHIQYKNRCLFLILFKYYFSNEGTILADTKCSSAVWLLWKLITIWETG